jgi:hypothetical protein
MSRAADRELEKRYVRRWQELGPILDRIRDEDIRRADTARSIQLFNEAFRKALRELPLRDTSGLVEWQETVKRWRQRG